MKTIKGWLKEAPRRHFGGSWEGFRGYEGFRGIPRDFDTSPWPPQKRLKSLYILIINI